MLKNPKVVVLHFTAGADWHSAWNTFANDTKYESTPGLREYPGVSAHFIVRKNGIIVQCVPLRLRARHAIGMNWTAIGIEIVQEVPSGMTGHWADQQILHRTKQVAAVVKLVHYLQGRFQIKTGNVIGHAMANDSPYFKERMKNTKNRTGRLDQAGRRGIPLAALAASPGRLRTHPRSAYTGAMAVRLEGIHFLVTYRCTYACDHCFVWGSPDADGTMTLAQLTSVIDQGAELGLADVYFEGGEPTLAYPIVLAAAKHARERGLDAGMVSNCFWATSVADAKIWLAPFAEVGLADLSLSSYAYFVEDANEEHLRNAVLAAQDLGVPVGVLEVGAPADIGVPGACSGDVGEVMHKGRAAVALAPAKASRPPETLTTCPFEDFTDPGRAHVGPDGELQVCQGISAGNVFAGGDGPPAPEHLAEPRAGGLAAVLDAYDPHARPVIREILAGGPWALAQAVGHTPERTLYADECHLCYEVRAALRRAGRFPEVVAPGQCYAENEAEEGEDHAV